jgi:ABC-type uncharacterized transport system permease subunit
VLVHYVMDYIIIITTTTTITITITIIIITIIILYETDHIGVVNSWYQNFRCHSPILAHILLISLAPAEVFMLGHDHVQNYYVRWLL